MLEVTDSHLSVGREVGVHTPLWLALGPAGGTRCGWQHPLTDGCIAEAP